MATSLVHGVILCAALVALRAMADDGGGSWKPARATFYGDMSGRATMNGACGYKDVFKQGYGFETTCVSSPGLFNEGKICGACFEIRCYNNTLCTPDTIKVTATNLCAPDVEPPFDHFDLSMVIYGKIAKQYNAGNIHVEYRRVPCIKTGGMRFEMMGGKFWIVALVYNVAGVGDVQAVSVKGSNGTDWVAMSRAWGQRWQTNEPLVGQGLSFRVTTSDGRTVESLDIAPANWQFGMVYEGNEF